MSPSVRNIRGLGGTKPIPVHVYIPPVFNPVHKIEIISGATTTDVTDFVVEGEYTYGVTATVGDFTFAIDNSTEEYTSLFSLWSEVKVYLDYGTSATTLRFVGRIERASKNNNLIVVSGRGNGSVTVGKNVTYSATDKARSTILTEIIQQYFSGTITTTNIETDSGTSTVNYVDVPFWTVVEDICQRAGFDAYIDTTYDFHYFLSGSRENTTEIVAHTQNLIETSDFSDDLQSVFNRVKVYGKQIEGIPALATSEDTASQSDFSVRELKIDTETASTAEQALAVSDFELSINKDPPTIGTVKSLLLPTLNPGEMVRISDPLNGLAPNTYQIQKFRQIFSNDNPPMTELTVQKERLDIPNILKGRINFEQEITSNVNPNEMDHSILFDFGSDVGTHSGTEIDTDLGILKLIDGNSTGTWTSPIIIVPTNVLNIETRISGSSILGTQSFISLDAGTTFTGVTFNQSSSSELGGGSIPNGNKIQIRIDFFSGSTEITAAGVLYTK